MEKVLGVVVTYHPEFERLVALLARLHAQVDSIVVVDNASPESFRARLSARKMEGLESIFLDKNLGIGAAQNIGVRRAKTRGATHVLLLDQDSLPAPDMVARLIDALRTCEAGGRRIAAVGPRIMDDRLRRVRSFRQVKLLSKRRDLCGDNQAIVSVDYLIASGCLIPMSIYDLVGLMREDLFIDYVDIEWGLRAKLRGFESIGVCAARMGHELGDEPINLIGRTFPVRAPLRHYYMFRNAIWIYSRMPFPLTWKVIDGWHLFAKYWFYICFARPRRDHFHMMTLGIWHGAKGKLGKLDGK